MTDSPLVIAGKSFRSRLLVGTGKYPSNDVMVRAHEASGYSRIRPAAIPQRMQFVLQGLGGKRDCLIGLNSK